VTSGPGRASAAAVAVGTLWVLSAVLLAALPESGRALGTTVVGLVSVPLAAGTAVGYALRAWLDRRAVAAVTVAAAAILAASAALDWAPGSALGKVLVGASLGLLAATVMEEPWNVALIAVLVVGVDIYSVFLGPTRKIVEDAPGLLSALTVPLAGPGRPRAALIGITDFVFLALFCAAALRFRLRPALTLPLLVASLTATILLTAALDRALPALPLLSAAFLLPNVRAFRPSSARRD
jgi:hypothetical protein